MTIEKAVINDKRKPEKSTMDKGEGRKIEQARNNAINEALKTATSNDKK